MPRNSATWTANGASVFNGFFGYGSCRSRYLWGRYADGVAVFMCMHRGFGSCHWDRFAVIEGAHRTTEMHYLTKF